MQIGDKVFVRHPHYYTKFTVGFVSEIMGNFVEVEMPLLHNIRFSYLQDSVTKIFKGNTEVEIIDVENIYFGKSGIIDIVEYQEIGECVEYRVFINNEGPFLFPPDRLLSAEVPDCNCSSYDLLHFGHKCGIRAKKVKEPGE